MKIVNNLSYFENREKPIKYTKFKDNKDTNHLSKTKYKPEKKYDYYKCDYCNDEIRLDKNQHERSGGIVILPSSLTKKTELTLCLCNRCLGYVIKEFE